MNSSDQERVWNTIGVESVTSVGLLIDCEGTRSKHSLWTKQALNVHKKLGYNSNSNIHQNTIITTLK